MGNVVIVGAGPAGISAALYTVRAGIPTKVIAMGHGALEKAEKVENYYGFPEPVTGPQLIENGIAQAERLGVELVFDEVVGLGFGSGSSMVVKTAMGEHEADSIVLATGASRKTPSIDGLERFEGSGVSHCAVCDAFFYRGKDVAVLGCSEYAVSEAKELLPIVNSVTLLTNGDAPTASIPAEVRVITEKVEAFVGGKTLEQVVFSDGNTLNVAGVFIAVGVAGSTDLARKMGIITEGQAIAVDKAMATNIPGIFAAGDCAGGMFQIAKAVYQGAVAGTEVVKYIRGL